MNRQTTKLPLSRRTLRQRIDTLANSLPGIDISALGPVFIGTPGQSDLVWAIQLFDGLSSQLTLTLFKQYMRRRKDGTSRNCRSANIWLRERTKWVRGLIQAIPVDPQTMRDEEGRKRVA
ncbi:TPA: replication endonuclease, partial [Aeromonas salmonicida]|nr:replication endonuclease [Aeromonas salmonicida]HDO1070827.1 replication endonuclease [Aeromonas salmonicida]HDO1106684.1 replication endonuclease [Aeromonas salmonicida]